MLYVPKKKISGEFLYQHNKLFSTYVRNCQEQGRTVPLESIQRCVSYSVSQSPEFEQMLDAQAESDDFEIGDALLFDKYVLHRSCSLGEGPLEARQSFIMRFIDTQSSFDSERLNGRILLHKKLGYSIPDTLSQLVGFADDKALIEHPMFGENIHDRIILYDG